jgi:mRNA interferase MazF
MTSAVLCPLTSTLRLAPLVRIAVEPSRRNGLRKPSQLMVDKRFTVPAEAVGELGGAAGAKISQPTPKWPHER